MKKISFKKALRICYFTAACVFVQLSCKQPRPSGGTQAPALSLSSITVHDIEVKNGKVTIGEPEIKAKDIKARFNYGSVKDELIDVFVEGNTFIADELKPKTLKLRVPPLEGIHGAWQGSVEVFYDGTCEPADPALLSLLSVSGGKLMGRDILIPEADIAKIMSGNSLTVDLKSPQAEIKLGSSKTEWSYLTVNDENVLFAPSFRPALKSYARIMLDLPEAGKSLPVKVKIQAGSRKTEIRFKIRREAGTVDIPKIYLVIDEIFVTEKDTLEKLADGSLPQFKCGDPSKIEIRCMQNEIQSVIVNQENAEIKERTVTTLEGKKPVWYTESTIKNIPAEGKEVNVTINPINTEKYHSVSWRFRIKPEASIPVNVLYTINRRTMAELGSDFIEKAENGSNPLLNFMGTSLNIELNYLTAELEEININGHSITGNALNWDGGFGGVVFYSIKTGTEEKQVTITLTPKDKPKFKDTVIKFRAKGDGSKEKIKAEIAIGEYDLPASFTEHLSDGQKPVHKVAESRVPIKIKVDEYIFKCLCSSIRFEDGVNDEVIDIEEVKKSFTVTHYLAQKEVDVDTPKEIKITFIPKDNDIAEASPWQFKLEPGGNKPSIPQKTIYEFSINNKGTYNNPLPSFFAEHLNDGTNPLYIIDGDRAKIKLLWRQPANDIIEKAVFKINDNAGIEISPQLMHPFYGAEYEVNLTEIKPKEYNVRIEIVSKAEEYGTLIYSFRLQNSGLKPPMPVQFGYDGNLVTETGTESILPIETGE